MNKSQVYATHAQGQREITMTCMYRLWLGNIVDTSIPKCSDALRLLSTFPTLEYKSVTQWAEYAQTWCRLSSFLWRHRKKQLYSAHYDMTFVANATTNTNVYWFEVLHAAYALAEATVTHACQALHTMRITEIKPSFGVTILGYPDLPMDVTLKQVRIAIGVCHFVATTLAESCIYIRSRADDEFQRVTSLHNTLTIIGLWINARKAMIAKEYAQARNLLGTIAIVGLEDRLSREAVSFVQTVQFFDFVCLVEQAKLDNKRGIAVGYARAAERELYLYSEKAHIASLVAYVTAAGAGNMPPIPAPGHALLTRNSEPNAQWLNKAMILS